MTGSIKQRAAKNARRSFVGRESEVAALDGIRNRLRAGALASDIGCELGASIVVTAQACPAAVLGGSDYPAGTINLASAHAADAGVADRTSLEMRPR
jgi:hypothetical protein